MCGRYALQSTPAELITRFGLDECADFSPRYIPPGTDIPVIRQSPEGRRVLHLLRWGLVPHWAKDPGILRTVCVVTSPNAVMVPIHERMPVIVAPENWQSWLSGIPEEVAGMVAPYNDEELQAWPVSRRVSKTQDDDAGRIEPITPDI